MNVIVIGTDPPCPRCDLVFRLVEAAAAAGLGIHVEHCAFDSSLARQIGARLGRKVGTAKHVARDVGIAMDWDAVHQVIAAAQAALPADARPADAWTPELDALLRPCQAAAVSAGYLMTPVLLINGIVVHHGGVPASEQVAAWLSGAQAPAR